jgi:hypothetical protein
MACAMACATLCSTEPIYPAASFERGPHATFAVRGLHKERDPPPSTSQATPPPRWLQCSAHTSICSVCHARGARERRQSCEERRPACYSSFKDRAWPERGARGQGREIMHPNAQERKGRRGRERLLRARPPAARHDSATQRRRHRRCAARPVGASTRPDLPCSAAPQHGFTPRKDGGDGDARQDSTGYAGDRDVRRWAPLVPIFLG